MMNEFVEVEDLGEVAPCAILLNTTSSEKRQNMDIDSIYKTCHLGEL